MRCRNEIVLDTRRTNIGHISCRSELGRRGAAGNGRVVAGDGQYFEESVPAQDTLRNILSYRNVERRLSARDLTSMSPRGQQVTREQGYTGSPLFYLEIALRHSGRS